MTKIKCVISVGIFVRGINWIFIDFYSLYRFIDLEIKRLKGV